MRRVKYRITLIKTGRPANNDVPIGIAGWEKSAGLKICIRLFFFFLSLSRFLYRPRVFHNEVYDTFARK